MRTLGPRDRRRGSRPSSRENRFSQDLQILAMQTDTRQPLVPSIPVSPEEWSRSHCQGMEQHADLARFGCCAAVPLALLTQRARTAVANAGGIDHAQAAIMLSPSFMRDQDVACGTPQSPIRLEEKVCTSEAACFPGRSGGRGSIP